MAVIINCKSQNTHFWNRNDLTVAYFDDIKKYPVLNAEEERELLIKYKNGNKVESEKALHKLVESNQRFIVSVARRWSTQDNLMDIVNEANLGLIKAINCFDLSKKQRLITYAVFWIRKYIVNYVGVTDKIVKPINAHKVFTYVNKIVNRFFAEYGRTPYPEEVQNILKEDYNIILSNIDDIAQYTVASIDAKCTNIDDDNNGVTVAEVGDFATTTASNNIKNEMDVEATKHYVNTILSSLTVREKDIVKRYYGIDCDEETLDNIAIHHDLSRERCRQILLNAIEKLKEKLINKNVK